jgi:hypothetical protein
MRYRIRVVIAIQKRGKGRKTILKRPKLVGTKLVKNDTELHILTNLR